MTMQHEIEIQEVENVPEMLQDGILYVSRRYCTAVHLCACGCRSETVTPLSDDGWHLSAGPTLLPSIGNQGFPCGSHYYIKGGRVEWLA